MGEWKPEVLELAYDSYLQGLPAEGREQFPVFHAVVPVDDNAPLIDRIVAYTGRQPATASPSRTQIARRSRSARAGVAPLQEPEQPVGIDPRHAYVVAYYVHKFREVGHGWSSGD